MHARRQLSTYRQHSAHDCLEDGWPHSETADVTVVHLVNPNCGRCADEEQSKLDGNGEHQDQVVDAVDSARRSDTLERLPAESLTPER